MTTQAKFVSFRESRTPEQRRAYIEEQLAKGNPKYVDRATWIKNNQDKIRLSILEDKVAKLLKE